MKNIFVLLMIIASALGLGVGALAKGGISLGYQHTNKARGCYFINQKAIRPDMIVGFDELTEKFKRSIDKSAPKTKKFAKIISVASQKTGVQKKRIKAIMMVESACIPDAVSHKGAIGLMQLMPRTAQQMGVRDPFNPWENVVGGAKYYRKQLDTFGSHKLALAAYNMGPPNLNARLKRGFDPNEYIYVQKIMYAERILLSLNK